jgi:hypothetical protein
MSSQYMKLDNTCRPQTSAITSNAKFIMPTNEVYSKTFTPMLLYPSNSHYTRHNTLFANNPEDIKAFSNNDFLRKKDNKNGCKSCSSG